jgi:hypothetical protein
MAALFELSVAMTATTLSFLKSFDGVTRDWVFVFETICVRAAEYDRS